MVTHDEILGAPCNQLHITRLVFLCRLKETIILFFFYRNSAMKYRCFVICYEKNPSFPHYKSL